MSPRTAARIFGIVVLAFSIGVASAPAVLAAGILPDLADRTGGEGGYILDGPPDGGGPRLEGGDPDEFFLGCVPANQPELFSRTDRPSDRPKAPRWIESGESWWIRLLSWCFWIR